MKEEAKIKTTEKRECTLQPKPTKPDAPPFPLNFPPDVGRNGQAPVMVRPWKASNYLKIGNWSVFVLFGWRFVFGIIMRWEGH